MMTFQNAYHWLLLKDNFKLCTELNDLLNKSKKIKRFKDTHKEKAPSNRTPTLSKSMNMGIWVVGTSHQLFTRGS